MYRLLIGAAMALTATSSFAADYVQQEPVSAPRISGYVEGYLGGVWLHVDDPFGGGESESGWAAGGDGRVNFPINDRWNIQTDAIVDSVWMNHQNIYGYGGAVHAYWRDPSRFAVGAFATITRYGGDDVGNPYSYTVGPEAQIYFGNVTLYGQGYYGQLEDFIPFAGVPAADIWGARAALRYYVRPDLRLDAELGFQKLNFPVFIPDIKTFSAAAQVMYRFSGTPWSVFARYQYERATENFGPASVHADLHKFIVGVRMNFGTGTLIDEDRNGATMDTVRPNYVLY